MLYSSKPDQFDSIAASALFTGGWGSLFLAEVEYVKSPRRRARDAALVRAFSQRGASNQIKKRCLVRWRFLSQKKKKDQAAMDQRHAQKTDQERFDQTFSMAFDECSYTGQFGLAAVAPCFSWHRGSQEGAGTAGWTG